MHLALRSLLVVAPTLVAVRAQIPDGSYVVSSFTGVATATPGGLFIVHPRQPGPPTVVQGLGPELTGVGTTQLAGANCVAIERGSGTLLVGEIASGPLVSVDVHWLAINAGVASTIAVIPIGTTNASANALGGVHQIAMLPDGDAILAVGGLANQPPLNGACLARLSPATGTVTPISTGALQGNCNSVAVDTRTDTIYFCLLGLGQGLFSVPLAGGVPTSIDPVHTSSGLAVSSQGFLWAGSVTEVQILDTTNGSVLLSIPVGSNVNGLGFEAATDQPVPVLNGISAAPGVFHCTGGIATLLTSGITGCGSGVAVMNSPRTYGQPTTGNVAYRFLVTPTPGGLPQAGNAAFGVWIDAVGAPANPGFLLGSFQQGSQVLLGVHVLIDPSSALTLGLITPGVLFPTPLPGWVPAGLHLHFQAFFVDAGAPQGIAASDGQLVGTIQ